MNNVYADIQRMVRRKKRMDAFKSFNWFKLLFSVVCLMTVATFIIAGWGLYSVVSSVHSVDTSQGVKPIIEKIWCGKPGCM